MFLSVFEWPQDGKLYLPGLSSKIVSSQLLKGEQKIDVKHEKQNGWTILNLPPWPADSPAFVIEVKLENNVKDHEVEGMFGIYPNIDNNLLTEFASVSNANKKSIRWMEKFGEWKKTTQVSQWEEEGKVEWEIDVFEPGFYFVELSYKGEGRLVWKTTTDEGIMVQNQQAATEKYDTYSMGIIEFKTAGKHTISVDLVEGNKKTSSLKSLIIKPIV